MLFRGVSKHFKEKFSSVGDADQEFTLCTGDNNNNNNKNMWGCKEFF